MISAAMNRSLCERFSPDKGNVTPSFTNVKDTVTESVSSSASISASVRGLRGLAGFLAIGLGYRWVLGNRSVQRENGFLLRHGQKCQPLGFFTVVLLSPARSLIFLPYFPGRLSRIDHLPVSQVLYVACGSLVGAAGLVGAPGSLIGAVAVLVPQVLLVLLTWMCRYLLAPLALMRRADGVLVVPCAVWLFRRFLAPTFVVPVALLAVRGTVLPSAFLLAPGTFSLR